MQTKHITAEQLPSGHFLVNDKLTLTAEELKKLSSLYDDVVLVIFRDYSLPKIQIGDEKDTVEIDFKKAM